MFHTARRQSTAGVLEDELSCRRNDRDDEASPSCGRQESFFEEGGLGSADLGSSGLGLAFLALVASPVGVLQKLPHSTAGRRSPTSGWRTAIVHVCM